MRARFQFPAQVRRGEAVAVVLRIEHPMESGFRRDPDGQRIPRNVVHTVVCRMAGEEVFRAELGSGISANPLLRFFVCAEASAEIEAEWEDEAGARGRLAAQLTVSG